MQWVLTWASRRHLLLQARWDFERGSSWIVRISCGAYMYGSDVRSTIRSYSRFTEKRRLLVLLHIFVLEMYPVPGMRRHIVNRMADRFKLWIMWRVMRAMPTTSPVLKVEMRVKRIDVYEVLTSRERMSCTTDLSGRLIEDGAAPSFTWFEDGPALRDEKSPIPACRQEWPALFVGRLCQCWFVSSTANLRQGDRARDPIT